MLIRIGLVGFILLLPAGTVAAPASLELLAGVEENGRATALWQAMIRKRLPDDAFAAVADLEKPLAAAERDWAVLIHSRSAEWRREIPALAAVFQPIPAPSARIVLGNRGGDDAFTHDAHTIGFDLERLYAIYGDASKPENTARIDRFFRHEYTHLLQKAWLVKHPVSLGSPLDLALAESWTEGMGNYHSLSDRWRASDGVPTQHARETLARLEPRFVARLAALACSSGEDARALVADLSRGPFDRKWGALTVALWLEQDDSMSHDALRNFVLAGPDGIWALAARHLPPPLRSLLDEIHLIAATCAGNAP